jgi:hypothetical protein
MIGELTGLLAVALIFGLPCLFIWTRHKRQVMEMNDAGSAPEMEKMRAQLARVEQRLAVLERLATDPSAKLAEQIDGLRDSRQY